MPQHIGIVACSAEGRRVVLSHHLPGRRRRSWELIIIRKFPCTPIRWRSTWTSFTRRRLGGRRRVDDFFGGKTGLRRSRFPDLSRQHHPSGIRPGRASRAAAVAAHCAEVACEATRRHIKKIGVLGTRYLMEGPVYPSKAEGSGNRATAFPAGAARENRQSFLTNWSMGNFCRVRRHISPK